MLSHRPTFLTGSFTLVRLARGDLILYRISYIRSGKKPCLKANEPVRPFGDFRYLFNILNPRYQ